MKVGCHNASPSLPRLRAEELEPKKRSLKRLFFLGAGRFWRSRCRIWPLFMTRRQLFVSSEYFPDLLGRQKSRECLDIGSLLEGQDV